MDNRPHSAADDALIVADIGGTNGRFAIAGGQPIELSHVHTFQNAGLGSLDELLSRYLAELPEDQPKRACLGMAGPSDGRLGRITNLDWVADASALEQRFGLEDVLLVNDFAALASAAPELPEHATRRLNTVESTGTGPISVLGPGTGLGVSLVTGDTGRRTTISTEAGHMSFAPTNRLEQDLHRYLVDRLEHVSVESLLSGGGLVRIHDFLFEQEGSGTAGLRPAEVTAAALDGSQPSCVHAVQMFLSILGSVAGDIALAHGATGGVYLGGGILPRIAPLLEQSNLCERFVAKGPMRDYLLRIPIRLITADQVALRGAAAIYRQVRRPL
jgi:glucokinase